MMSADVVTRLERLPPGSFHRRLLLICGTSWLFGAMNTALIAFVLPQLEQEWQLGALQMGWISSSGLLGMALGAILSGALVNRLGNRFLFVATLLLYSTATGLCGWAWDWGSLLVLRFLVGLGLGGQLPVAVTLVSAFAPPALRGRYVLWLESFWGLGWLIAALIGYLLLPYLGWRGVFWLGALPVVYVLYLRELVPETVTWLLRHGRMAQAHALVQALERSSGLPPAADAIAPAACAQTPDPQAARMLWQQPLLSRTLVLWLIWFGVFYSYYGMTAWLPHLMLHHSIGNATAYLVWMALAQLPGYFAAAWLVERWGQRRTLACFLAACALCTWLFAHASTPAQLLLWGCWMLFFHLGAWGVLYSMTPECYPAAVRSLATGLASGVGRTGGVLSPLVVAGMVAGYAQLSGTFSMFAAVLLVVAAIVMTLGQDIPPPAP